MKRITYADLNDIAKENYNFHKVAAVLADYGFNSVRLTDDVQGADFLAIHIDGSILKVQLKGRLTVEHYYTGKNLWIAFPHDGNWYLFPHDEVQAYFVKRGRKGAFSAGSIAAKDVAYFEQFRLQAASSVMETQATCGAALLADAMRRDYVDVKASADPAWRRTDALKVIDCVLSLNRNYDRFVAPRLDRFENEHKEIVTVSDLQALMRSYDSPHNFVQTCLNYNHEDRADILMAVVDYLATVGDLSDWARTADVAGYRKLRISGFGIAGWQYLRMLFGADTVKPDIYIKRYVEQVIGKSIGDEELVRLFEDASRTAGLSAINVDNAIWEESARLTTQ